LVYLSRVQEQLLILLICNAKLADSLQTTHEPSIHFPKVFRLYFRIVTPDYFSKHLFKGSVDLDPVGKIDTCFKVGFSLSSGRAIPSSLLSSYEELKNSLF